MLVIGKKWKLLIGIIFETYPLRCPGAWVVQGIRPNIISLWYIWTKILQKGIRRSRMACPIRNELTKLSLYFQKMYLFLEYSRSKNNLTRKLTGQNVGRSPMWVWRTIHKFGSSMIKKPYFYPILGVSLKMYLLPGFISFTFKTEINV
jgi:hypothetical protein